jgi:succinate dehydrogenase / fumarate reductase, cytochrome b subunit
MNIIHILFRSSLGKKYLMAITGLALLIYVIGHMLGNLQIFLGRDVINTYAQFLHSNQTFLWLVRLGFLTVVGLHIWSAISLTADNRAARPMGYEGNPTPLAASYASRTMIMSGVIIAIFVVYHLLHFTVQTSAVNLTGADFRKFEQILADGSRRHDVYRMMIVGFQNPIVSIFYLAGVGLLCLHLSHGIAAMLQSLGLKNRRTAVIIDQAARAIAWVIFLGYASIPIGVLLGLGKHVAF